MGVFTPGAEIDMCCTCKYVLSMPKMIQIRHVPDQVHRKLKARAATKGMSLSDYLLLEISELAKLPTDHNLSVHHLDLDQPRREPRV